MEQRFTAKNFYGEIIFGQFSKPGKVFFKLTGIKVLLFRYGRKMIAALTVQITVFGDMNLNGK